MPSFLIFLTEQAAKRAVDHGLMPVLFQMYTEYHWSDHRNRQIALRKAILNLIKACVMHGEFQRKLKR